MHYFLSDPSNLETLKAIESALFVVCLDQASGVDGVDDRSSCAYQTLHGGGAVSNGGNRWFDKTIQVILYSLKLETLQFIY